MSRFLLAFRRKGGEQPFFGSLRVGGGAWYGEYGRDAGKGTKAGEIGRGGTGNAKSPNWSCIPLTVAVRDDT